MMPHMDSKICAPLDTYKATIQQDSVLIDLGEAMRPELVRLEQDDKKQYGCSLLPQQLAGIDTRWVIHGVKIGLALVLVSLLYMLEVVHDRLGDNAMWAVMTVIVVFEYTTGATIGKGINRGIGTILGGGLGSLVALLAQEIGGIGKALLISASVFFISIPASYLRMVPNFKKKYDYGVMIFILTFSLVAISGIRGDEIIKIACDRLSSICMGFAICIFISLLVFPNWAGDELHRSLATKFHDLACSIEDCLEDNINPQEGKRETQTADSHKRCRSIISSKSTDETLAKNAKWEPWHGRFGFSYPWNKYLQIGELLRGLSCSVIALSECLQFIHKHSPSEALIEVRESCEISCTLLAIMLREFGSNICNMKRNNKKDTIMAKFHMLRSELCAPMHLTELAIVRVSSSCIVFQLLEVMAKAEEIAKEVEELGDVAGFTHVKNIES